MAEHLRLLLVGAGDRATRGLLPALRAAAVPIQVTAVCDPAPETADRVAGLAAAGLLPAGVAVHGRLGAALDAGSYELAIVACPHDQHLAAVLALADAGVVVWKEKPFALTVADALRLAARSAGGLRVLAHRPHGQLQRIAAALLPGWGGLLSYRIRITRQTSDYSATWRATTRHAGGGAILDLGYHAFDLIARLPLPPASVYAVAGRSPAHRAGVEVEESAYLTLTHPGGAVGTVYLSRCDERADEVDLVAERGRISISGDQARIQVAEPRGLTHTVSLSAADNPVAAMIRHHTATLTDPAVTAAEVSSGVRATALIEAAYISLRLGRPAPAAAIYLPRLPVLEGLAS
jgi:predicted dehydrogenase